MVGVLLGFLTIGLPACTSLKQVEPAEFLAANSPDVLWVTQAGNALVPVAKAEIVGDTLKGTWEGTQRPVAIALADVQRVEARVPDKTKTILLFTTLGAGAVSAVYFMWISKAGPMPAPTCGYDQRGFPIPYC